MSETYVDRAGLKIAEPLARFLEERALPGTGIAVDAFWRGTTDIYARLAPEKARLLAVRDTLQARIDAWHDARAGQPIDQAAYQAFLREIGYLVDEPAPFAQRPLPAQRRERALGQPVRCVVRDGSAARNGQARRL